ncbi:MAG: peptidoglycan-binding protein [Rhizobiaceae bacterium]|nr:peptidoglycan-binding protein [Rhizobiaceae bacterium]
MSKIQSQLNKLTAELALSKKADSQSHHGEVKSEQSPGIASRSESSGVDIRLNSQNAKPNRNINEQNRRELAGIKSILQGLSKKLMPGKTVSHNKNLQYTAGTTNDELPQSLRKNLRKEMGAEIDKMRRELGAMQLNANKANDSLGLEDIHRISQGIRELQSRQVVSPGQFSEMAGELRGMHRDIRALNDRPVPQFDAQEISNSIQNSYGEIARRLDSLASPQAGVPIEAIGEKLEAIRDSVQQADPQTLMRIEQQLQILGGTITQLTQQGPDTSINMHDGVLPEYFENLDRRLDEITRALAATSSAAQLPTDESAFDRIEARITSLAKSIDNIAFEGVAATENSQMSHLLQMPEQLQSNLSSLENQIAQLTVSLSSDGANVNEEFGGQLASLTQKIDQLQNVSPALSDTAVASQAEVDIGEKIDLMSQSLERAINSGDSTVGKLESQIEELANRIEQATAAEQAEKQSRLQNETHIVTELQALTARIEQIDQGFATHQPQDLQLSALENQISAISSQLQSLGGQPDMSAIESRLGGIEEQVAAGIAVGPGENADFTAAISNLAEDLKELTLTSTELKGHSLETFDAVRDSLSMILDRINSIESRMDNEEATSSHVVLPDGSDSEIHNSEMVDAARDYASNLEAKEKASIYQEAEGELSTANELISSNLPDANDLPQVSAPSLDLQHLPAMEEVPAPTIEPLDSDLPLEPGSGAPDLAGDGPDMGALMKQAKDNKRKFTLEEEQQNPTDFIAAARRAAQAAARDTNLQENGTNPKTGSKQRFSLKEMLSRKKKPLMLSAAVVAIAIAAYPVVMKFTGSAPVPTKQVAEAQIAEVPELSALQPAPKPAPMIISEGEAQNDAIDEMSSTLAQSPQPPIEMPMETVEASESLVPQITTAVDSPVQVSEPSMARQITTAPMPPQEVGPIALRQAAASGDAKALFEVGRRYTEGLNGSPDLAQALQWYQRSADAQFAPAQYRLGNFYEKGHGVTSDVNKAATWYKRSAEQGNALAMHNLAVINAMGVLEGGANMTEAAVWFKKAADHGVKDSQVNLGIVYAKAMGVDADLVEAYKWFAIAANGGDKDAAQKRDTVAKQLRPDQLVKARGEVELWRPQELKPEANNVDVPVEWKTSPEVTASLTGTQMIEKTQSILTKLGYKPGPSDGIMGAKTTKAIKKFQARAGIAVTGEITPELVSALVKANI